MTVAIANDLPADDEIARVASQAGWTRLDAMPGVMRAVITGTGGGYLPIEADDSGGQVRVLYTGGTAESGVTVAGFRPVQDNGYVWWQATGVTAATSQQARAHEWSGLQARAAALTATLSGLRDATGPAGQDLNDVPAGLRQALSDLRQEAGRWAREPS
jgi:hypothetical protein